MPITLPYTFSNGQIADAAQVNANFTALATGTAERIQILQSVQNTPVVAPPNVLDSSSTYAITNLNLTPGDWDVRGVIWYQFTISAAVPWTARFSAFFDTASGGWGDVDQGLDDWNATIAVNAPSNELTPQAMTIPTCIRRIQLATPRIYYLCAYAWVRQDSNNLNIITTMSARGIMTARRLG